MENKDFYVIELKKKIKVGITYDFKKRYSSIKTGSGIKDNEVVNVFHYPDLSLLESRIKRLFKKQKIAGEWFYKQDIVLDFVEILKNGAVPTINLLDELKNKQINYSDVFKVGGYPYDEYAILKENAINLLEKIKSERIGIGYPDSIDLAKFMRTKRAGYRNIVYIADDEFLYFERKPNFDLESIKDSQIIECLRIIKNTTPNNNLRNKLQNYIDSIFAKNDTFFQKSIDIIKAFFFELEEEIAYSFLLGETEINQNIKMSFEEEGNFYSLTKDFEELDKTEQIFLKKSKDSNLNIDVFGMISFDYKSRFCFCHFDVINYLRVLNFFSIQTIDIDNLRLIYNDTEIYKKHYVFRYKYHLLNGEEKQFIRKSKIEDTSYWYINFISNGEKYYCLYNEEDKELISKELNIDFEEYD